MNTLILIPLLGILLLYLGLYKQANWLLPVAIAGLLGAIGLTVITWNCPNKSTFSGMLRFDHFAVVFSCLSIFITMLLLLLSKTYFEKISSHVAEYYALMLFALTGMIMMVSYHNLTMLFIGIETTSVSLYILTGIRKKDYLSNEAALKYFLMGAFATGILLMGIAFIYGATGTFDLEMLHNYVVDNQGAYGMLFYVGLLLLIVALCFKVGVAPFHFWTPDVYEGAPSLITGFMSTVVKIAGFATFLRLFTIVFAPLWQFWSPVLFVVIVVTLLIGNITALYQKTFKRMLAYSSISHAGYLLLAILALGEHSDRAILLYGVAYSLASLIAFAVLIKVKEQFGNDSFDSFNGLAKNNPYVAFSLTVAMLSFAGIPLTAGFMGKFLLFNTALEKYQVWIVVLAVLNAAIGIYYYFKVIVAMYFRLSASNVRLMLPLNYKWVIAICLLLTFALGVYPSCLLGLL